MHYSAVPQWAELLGERGFVTPESADEVQLIANA